MNRSAASVNTALTATTVAADAPIAPLDTTAIEAILRDDNLGPTRKLKLVRELVEAREAKEKKAAVRAQKAFEIDREKWKTNLRTIMAQLNVVDDLQSVVSGESATKNTKTPIRKEEVEATSSSSKHSKEAERIRIMRVFKSFDTDNSGAIDAAEFQALAFELGEVMSDEEVARCMTQIDVDDDGTICLAEFTKWWQSDDRVVGTSDAFASTSRKMQALKLKLASHAVRRKGTAAVVKLHESASAIVGLSKAREIADGMSSSGGVGSSGKMARSASRQGVKTANATSGEVEFDHRISAGGIASAGPGDTSSIQIAYAHDPERSQMLRDQLGITDENSAFFNIVLMVRPEALRTEVDELVTALNVAFASADELVPGLEPPLVELIQQTNGLCLVDIRGGVSGEAAEAFGMIMEVYEQISISSAVASVDVCPCPAVGVKQTVEPGVRLAYNVRVGHEALEVLADVLDLEGLSREFVRQIDHSYSHIEFGAGEDSLPSGVAGVPEEAIELVSMLLAALKAPNAWQSVSDNIAEIVSPLFASVDDDDMDEMGLVMRDIYVGLATCIDSVSDFSVGVGPLWLSVLCKFFPVFRVLPSPRELNAKARMN